MAISTKGWRFENRSLIYFASVLQVQCFKIAEILAFCGPANQRDVLKNDNGDHVKAT